MNKLRSYGILLCVFAISIGTYAQEKPYPIGSSTSVLSNFRRQLAATKPNDINRLQLQLSPTLHMEAVINYHIGEGTASEKLIGCIANVPNSSFYLMVKNNSVQGHILLRDSKQAYTYSSDNNGVVAVQETDIDKIICIGFKEAVEPVASAARVNTVMNVTALADLQSYPGGNGCVLLDFDGEVVSGTLWNGGGVGPINAAPANLSDGDKQQAWELVSEAFRPFSLNITTSEAVFNSYPHNKRMRCIFTPTNTAAPGSGGVAYYRSFTWGDTPCWVFNTGGKYAGDAAAHEIGHTFDLQHDGRTTPAEGYYAGQGTWAPIMGVGYYKSLVQWSKGEYANANSTQDDLAYLSADFFEVGYRADDCGNTTTAARLLTMDASGNVSNKGVIERTADVDMFSFTTSGGPVNLTFNPNAFYPTLDILATLYDNSGTAITTSDLPGLNAGISTTLAAGKYYVSVAGTGSADPLTTGYSNYGSLGNYTITGTIPNLIVLSNDTGGTPRKSDNPPSSKQVASLVVSPNPAANRITLQYGKRNSFFDVTIRDVNGIVVYTASHIQTGQQINITSLTAGLYFITIYTGKEILTEKLIKH